jgi:hypothetical protein
LKSFPKPRFLFVVARIFFRVVMNIGAHIHAWTANSSRLRHRTIEAGN